MRKLFASALVVALVPLLLRVLLPLLLALDAFGEPLHELVHARGGLFRAVGLVGHILEESREPMAEEIWHRMEAEATRHVDKKGGKR